MDEIGRIVLEDNTQPISWSTNKSKKIAVTVDSENQNICRVTGIKGGIAYVYAKIGEKKYTCKVVVKKPMLSKSKLNLKKGNKKKISLKNTKKKVEWESLDKSIATVENGRITGVGNGVTSVIATAGNKTYSCLVMVGNGKIELKLDQEKLKLQSGESYALSLTQSGQTQILNEYAAWGSSNPEIVSVSPNGVVTANASGKAAITATYNGKSIVCQVTVDIEDSDIISFVESGVILTIGETYTPQLNLSDKFDLNDVKWRSSNKEIVTVNQEGKVTSVSTGNCVLYAGIDEYETSCSVTVMEKSFAPELTYQVQVADHGWMNTVSSGETAGTTGETRRMESLIINLKDSEGNSGVNYNIYSAGLGWTGAKSSGETAGTVGKSIQAEAVKISLNSNFSEEYDIYYRVYTGHIGWQEWAKNGEVAGSTELGNRMEAIQILLVSKETEMHSGSGYAAELKKPTLAVQAHVSHYGWMGVVGENEVAGTTGEARQLEGLKLVLNDFGGNSAIQCRAHVAHKGWLPWVNSGELCGTAGESTQMEAIQLRLTGYMSEFFDVYYRVHVADNGWLGWAKNGEIAGSTGLGKRAEAIQVRLVKKGEGIKNAGTPFISSDGSTSSIMLSTYMGSYSMNQHSYSQFVVGKKNVGCFPVAIAVGTSVLNKQAYNPVHFWNGSLGTDPYGKFGGYVSYSPQAIYNNLKKGKPTMVHSGSHWVLIIGVNGDINLYGNFIAVDPCYGDVRKLNQCWSFNGKAPTGMKLAK